MPRNSRTRCLPALAAAGATVLLLAGPAGAASGPPTVWQASTLANRVGATLAGRHDADRMTVTDCDRTGRFSRTCSVEVTRTRGDTNSDCTWKVVVTRTRHGLRRRTGPADCTQGDGEEEYATPFGKSPITRAQRRSKARAYRIASGVAVRRARRIEADNTAVWGCDNHHSTDRVCQVNVSHGQWGNGATCWSLVFVPPVGSRRPVRTMSLGPCSAN